MGLVKISKENSPMLFALSDDIMLMFGGLIYIVNVLNNSYECAKTSQKVSFSW